MQKNNKKKIIADDPIDLRQSLYKYLIRWKLIMLSLCITCSGAFLFVHFTSEVYSVSSILMVGSSDEKPIQFKLPGDFMVQEDSKNLGLQTLLLQSFPILFESIKRLNWRVSYFSNRRLGRREIYCDAPFTIELDDSVPQVVNVNFDISFITDSTFQISSQEQEADMYNYLTDSNVGVIQLEGVSLVSGFGKKIVGKGYSFVVIRQDDVEFNSYGYQFHFNDLILIAKSQKENLKIAPLEGISALQISVLGENIKKNVDFLSEINKTFIESNLMNKNRISNNTISFVNNQLSILSDSLDKSGHLLRDFRQEHNLLDVNEKVNSALGKFNAIEAERVSLQSKLRFYTYLLMYVNDSSPENTLFSPSVLGIEDSALTALVEKLVHASEELTRLKATVNSSSEYYILVEDKISKIKKQIIENLKYNKMLIESNLKELRNKNNLIESEIDSLPETQQRLLAFERMYKINDQLYTFLLQKKAEAQLTLASSTPDHRVVEFADTEDAKKIEPKAKLVFILAFILGLGFPFLLIEVITFFNNTIDSQKEVSRFTDAPIVGKILNNPSGEYLIMLKDPKSLIAESFRSVRTNLQYMGMQKEGEAKVILITSALSGDGKTFVALNLATAYALSGKKTVLLGFDLRKPRLHSYLNEKNNIGLSTYYSGNVTYSELGCEVGGIENLTAFHTGPIPPNPSELIGSVKTRSLFDNLMKDFEIVIVDTPPVALVTDAYMLMEYSSVQLCVVRQQHTDKTALRNALLDIEQKNMSVSILMNDVDLREDRYYNGYRYDYSEK